MLNWAILLTIITVTNGQSSLESLVRKNEADTRDSQAQIISHKSNTFIENKNVNILVNVDAKVIAEELWKVIETHLKLKSNQPSFDSQVKMGELKSIADNETIVNSSRRVAHDPSPLEISHELDHVTPSAISNDLLRENSLDTEIGFRNIMSEMLEDVKGVKDAKKVFDKEKSLDSPAEEHRRQLSVPSNNNEFVDLKIQILKEDLAKALETSLDKSE